MVEHSAMDRTVGLDVGDRETHFCILDEVGEILEEGRFRSTRAGLEGRFRSMPRTRVVLEVGALSPWMSRDLEAFGHEVLVANSYQMGRIYKGQDKTDRHDAQTLARLGRSDPKLLRPLQHRRSRTPPQRSARREKPSGLPSRPQHGRAIRETCAVPFAMA